MSFAVDPVTSGRPMLQPGRVWQKAKRYDRNEHLSTMRAGGANLGKRMRSIVTFVLFSIFLLPNAALSQEAEPFHTRNLNPAIAIFGLPTWEAVTGVQVLSVTTEIANHYRLSRRGTDTLVLDGETTRVDLFYSRPLGKRWAVSAELPLIQQSGGILDDLVDGWHSAFRLPDGGRNNRPDGELLFAFGRDGQPFFRLNDEGSGLGDMQVTLARRFAADERFVARASVKIPTGKESILAGSGAGDWSVTLLRPRAGTLRGRAAGYFWGVGVLALGEPERIAFPVDDHSIVGIVGGGLQILPKFGIKAQIDVYSAMYDTPLEELGQHAVQATIGGWWDAGTHTRADFAINEDLHVSTAPDVVVHLGLRWQW
jgi:hypothetical protein